jgi:hypothetical protein
MTIVSSPKGGDSALTWPVAHDDLTRSEFGKHTRVANFEKAG